MCIKRIVLVALWPLEGMSVGDTGGCVSVQHRYRRLEQPAQFGGRRCAGHLWDEQTCQAETTCTGPPGCGQDFQCKETGESTRHKFLPQRFLGLGVSVPCHGQQEGEPLQVKAGIFSHLLCFPLTSTENHPCCTLIWVEKKAVWHGECEFLVEQREWEYSVPTAVCSHSPWWAQRSQQRAAFSPARDRVQSSIQPAICWGDLVIFSHLQL